MLLQNFVLDDQALQVAVLYATQLFCHDCDFPKGRWCLVCPPISLSSPSPSGLMLRVFSYLYDMDVVEEEAFMKWREDISQQFPGKGKALFQVRSPKFLSPSRSCLAVLSDCKPS